MKILETTINGLKRYVGRDCSFNYDGTVIDIKVGIINLMVINVQSIVSNGSEKTITITTGFGIVNLKKD